METVLKAISDWIKSLLTAATMSNLSGLFDDVNTQVGGIAQQVGTKPSSFEPRVFAMIEALSRNVVLPIAGIILTFIACYELIEMITQHNNMAQFEPALLMKWIFKTAISVWMISNTCDIIMAVFDVTQQVVANSSGIISGNTRVNEVGLSMLEASMMQMEVGPLFGLFLQSLFIGISMRILSIIIFVLVYGRMIEIYMMVSLAPVPMAIRATDREISSIAKVPKEKRPEVVAELRKPKGERDSSITDSYSSPSKGNEFITTFKQDIQGHKKGLNKEETQNLKDAVKSIYSPRRSADGEAMMCEIQGAQEDFVRRWEMCFREYPDILTEPRNNEKLLIFIDRASRYLQNVKKTLEQ